MTAYKLVTIKAPYWGFGGKLEQALLAVKFLRLLIFRCTVIGEFEKVIIIFKECLFWQNPVYHFIRKPLKENQP